MNETTYYIVSAESFPFGKKIVYFYLPASFSVAVGDVLTTKTGAQYRITAGQGGISFKDIDQTKYRPFE